MKGKRKEIIYGEHGPTNYGWHARIVTRCRELGMSTTGLMKMGLGRDTTLAVCSDWGAYFTKRKSNASHQSSKWGEQIDNNCPETQEDIKDVIRRAQGNCECCGRHYDDVYNDPSLKRPLNRMCIDHDHETGAVRAYLCGVCNMAEGLFAHDPEAILRVHEYLVREFQK
jgi:hypothetical protein